MLKGDIGIDEMETEDDVSMEDQLDDSIEEDLQDIPEVQIEETEELEDTPTEVIQDKLFMYETRDERKLTKMKTRRTTKRRTRQQSCKVMFEFNTPYDDPLAQ